jgi:hypothetical protein
MKMLIITITLLFGVFLARAADPLDTWAARYVAASTLNDVAYGAGLFVAVGDVCYTSPDGVCWTRRDLDTPAVNGLRGVAYGNDRFVAVEPAPWHRPGSAYVSTNGISWQRSADLPGNSLPVIERVYFGGGTFLAVGQEPNPAPASGKHWLVMASADGVTWSRHGGPTNDGDYHYMSFG